MNIYTPTPIDWGHKNHGVSSKQHDVEDCYKKNYNTIHTELPKYKKKTLLLVIV